jgi:hypothetical protein
VDIQKTRMGVDVLITVIKVLFNYNKVEYIDLLIILLCEIAGVVKGLMHSPTHSLTYSLTYLLTYSPTYSLPYSLTHL